MSEHYSTAAGSRVEISGKHRSISTIDFDWFEEGACVEAKRNVNVELGDEPRLHWYCDCCGGGSAPLDR